MKSLKILSLVLALTLAFSVTVFADDPEPIDINSSAIIKNMSNFVKTMYYEPRDRVNNVIFYDGEEKEENRLSSVKDYYVEYENNMLPGTATVTYTGVGKYTGTFKVTFNIAKMPIANITTKASYNSKKQLVVTANNGSEDLVYGTDFTTTAVTDVDGNVTVTFTGKGAKYTGTCKKVIKAKNNPYPAPRSYLKNIVLTKYKNIKGKKVQLKWRKLSNIAGYQIRYSMKSSYASAKKVTLANTAKSFKTKKLKKKTTCYIKIRCYIIHNNKKYYGNWTSVRVKIKK